MLSKILGRAVSHEGLTDLTLNGLKVSGNSQRRRLRYLMFHGTFLNSFEIPMIGRYLRAPSKQPDYRRNRTHEDFLTNIRVPSEKLKDALRSVWMAQAPALSIPDKRIQDLVQRRYSLEEWNLKM
jgi:lipoate-protein ligase A